MSTIFDSLDYLQRLWWNDMFGYALISKSWNILCKKYEYHLSTASRMFSVTYRIYIRLRQYFPFKCGPSEFILIESRVTLWKEPLAAAIIQECYRQFVWYRKSLIPPHGRLYLKAKKSWNDKQESL